MQRDSVISLPPAAEAAYGCVDWYLYQSPTAESAEPAGVIAGYTLAAPCSSIIERAAVAAGAAITGAARTPSQMKAGAQSAC
jgi:hypothetical protein